MVTQSLISECDGDLCHYHLIIYISFTQLLHFLAFEPARSSHVSPSLSSSHAHCCAAIHFFLYLDFLLPRLLLLFIPSFSFLLCTVLHTRDSQSHARWVRRPADRGLFFFPAPSPSNQITGFQPPPPMSYLAEFQNIVRHVQMHVVLMATSQQGLPWEGGAAAEEDEEK